MIQDIVSFAFGIVAGALAAVPLAWGLLWWAAREERQP